MRNFRIFDSASTYEEFTESENYVLPNVSLVMEDGSVHYKEDYTKEYLTIEALATGYISFKIASLLTEDDLPYVEYSVNGNDWIQVDNVNDTQVDVRVQVNGGDNVRWRANAERISINTSYTNQYFSDFGSNIRFNVYGNIMSLFYGDDFEDKKSFKNGYSRNLQRLFYYTNVVSANNLILPATSLNSFDYEYMFYGCSNLISAPDLPATTISSYTYQNMFSDCRNLIYPPRISCKNFKNYSCEGMFNNCQKIESPPIMKCESVSYMCFSEMFRGCKNLKTMPLLPCTSLSTGCYRWMFSYCESLTSVSELPALNVPTDAYRGMFDHCKSLTSVPDLPAKSVSSYGYYSMFQGCESLTKAPSLAITSTTNYCCAYMFSQCKNLKYPPKKLEPEVIVSNSYLSMFSGCENLEYMPIFNPTDIFEYGCTSMFHNCKSITNANLCFPQTHVYLRGISSMFGYCQNLEEVNVGSIVVAGNSALSSMFSNCENLSKISIECQNANNYDNVFESWTERVGANGIFVAGDNDTTNWLLGKNGIPRTWSHNTDAEDQLEGFKVLWIDDFPQDYVGEGEINVEAEVSDPDSYGANAFVYQDEIEYDGETMYLWAAAGDLGLGAIYDTYLVTTQNSFDGITMEDDIDNRYHPYAMLYDDMSLWYDEDDLAGDYDYVFVKYEEY